MIDWRGFVIVLAVVLVVALIGFFLQNAGIERFTEGVTTFDFGKVKSGLTLLGLGSAIGGALVLAVSVLRK